MGVKSVMFTGLHRKFTTAWIEGNNHDVDTINHVVQHWHHLPGITKK